MELMKLLAAGTVLFGQVATIVYLSFGIAVLLRQYCCCRSYNCLRLDVFVSGEAVITRAKSYYKQHRKEQQHFVQRNSSCIGAIVSV
jgi:hypothetical protein